MASYTSHAEQQPQLSPQDDYTGTTAETGAGAVTRQARAKIHTLTRLRQRGAGHYRQLNNSNQTANKQFRHFAHFALQYHQQILHTITAWLGPANIMCCSLSTTRKQAKTAF